MEIVTIKKPHRNSRSTSTIKDAIFNMMDCPDVTVLVLVDNQFHYHDIIGWAQFNDKDRRLKVLKKDNLEVLNGLMMDICILTDFNQDNDITLLNKLSTMRFHSIIIEELQVICI